MIPKIHIEYPYKFYHLYKGDELIFIEECKSTQDFIMLVIETFESIDLKDPSYRIETRETETIENEGWE